MFTSANEMKRKKICILTISLNMGGAERVISLLLKELVHDYDVTLVLLSDDIEFDIPDAVNVLTLGKSNILKNKPPHSKLMSTVMFIYKYYKIVKREKFDITMSFLALPNIINSIIANHVNHKNTHTVISERCYPSEMYKSGKFSMKMAKIFYPIFYNKNDRLFSNSVHINEDLKNNFGIKIPMNVIYNPIEIQHPNQFVDSYNGEAPFKIINVGSHSHAKNQELILNALRTLDNTVELTILGTGNLTQNLSDYIQTHAIQNSIHMPGKVKNVGEYLNASDCFILSSVTEGFPNVLLEAMATGVPVISTNCLSGPLEILNDNEAIQIEDGEFYLAKYGILINVNDNIALAKAISFFKDNHDVRKKYSTLGYEKAKMYDLPEIYKQVKLLIDNE
jgi:N-acetylgalactosamine-N,N'-diacetylbacillosaminyl-diphospho-undecaprenol 4-alpha-N-acetylgalactosaminyltransferase